MGDVAAPRFAPPQDPWSPELVFERDHNSLKDIEDRGIDELRLR